MGRPKGLRKGPDGKWYMPAAAIAGEILTEMQDNLKHNVSKDKKRRAIAQDHNEVGSKRTGAVAPAAVASPDPQPSVRSKRAVSIDWQRNDIVTAEDGTERKTGLVLGWKGTKIVVQLLDGTTRLTLDESRVHSINEVRA